MDNAVDLTTVIGQSAFAYGLMAAVGVAAAFLIRGIVLTLESMHGKAAAAKVAPVQVAVIPAPTEDETRARHVAAITAAVYTILGAHRLVYIGEVSQAPGWKVTGRAIHHTSHTPKRSPER